MGLGLGLGLVLGLRLGLRLEILVSVGWLSYPAPCFYDRSCNELTSP